MNLTLSPPPDVLSCRTTADFLAALPHLIGYTASNSLFVVCFTGKRAGRAMRVDLPPDERPSTTLPLLELLSDILGSLEEPDGGGAPALVITTDRTFAEAGDAPWRVLARRITRRLRRDGFAPREFCCIASDGWVSYLEPAAPPLGHPLREIEESPISRQAREIDGTIPDLSELGALPRPDRRRTAALTRALEDWHQPDCPAIEDATVIALGRALRGDTERLTPRMTARLLRAAEHSDRWLLLAVGILTRPEFPGELAPDLPPGVFTDVPIDPDAEPENPIDSVWSIRRLLTSLTPEFEAHERLRPIRQMLLTAAAEAPESLRPGVLALSAWLWWGSGSQTVAQRQVGLALEIDPAHEISRMVERLTAVPLPPHRWIRGGDWDRAPRSGARR